MARLPVRLTISSMAPGVVRTSTSLNGMLCFARNRLASRQSGQVAAESTVSSMLLFYCWPLYTFQLGMGTLVHDVASIQRGVGLEEQEPTFLVGNRFMFHPT